MSKLSLNRVFLVGSLANSPVLRYVPSGTPVANFSLAVYRGTLSEEGKEYFDYFNIVAWKDLALFCQAKLHKGDVVFVEGRIQVRVYEDSGGQRRKTWEIVASDIKAFAEKEERESKAIEEKNDLELS